MNAHSQLRILFAIGGLDRGGSEIQFTRMLEHLPQLPGNAGVLLQDGAARSYLPRVVATGAEVHILPDLSPLWRPVRVAARLVLTAVTVYRFRPQLIYAWLEEAGLYLVPVGRVLRIPVVVARRNVSGSTMERRHRSIGIVQRQVERMATLVTTNSEAAAIVARDRGIAPERIRVIPNGHEPALPLPFPPVEELVIGYLANFRPEKGHRMMIDAIARVADRPGWRVVFGGSGPLYAEMKARAHERGVEHLVEFVTVQDSREFWAHSHIAMLLSDDEGSPNALIEAAFAGRPIIATAVGGTPEVVGEGAGILIAPGDVTGAAAAIEHLLDHRDGLAEMGRRAWAYASRTFTIETMVQGHLAALREAHALGGRR